MAVALVVAAPSPAGADAGAWIWTETRIPLLMLEGDPLRALRLRVATDTRLFAGAGGLTFQNFRAGPLVDLTRWLFIAFHGALLADRVATTGAFEMEVRVEVEPNFHGRLGPFTFNDRNRLEYRWRSSSERFRYRNQLRVNLAPLGWRVMPYVWDELLVDLPGAAVVENRLSAGVGIALSGDARLDVGYLWRTRTPPAAGAGPGPWQHDHAALVSILYTPPPRR